MNATIGRYEQELWRYARQYGIPEPNLEREISMMQYVYGEETSRDDACALIIAARDTWKWNRDIFAAACLVADPIEQQWEATYLSGTTSGTNS